MANTIAPHERAQTDSAMGPMRKGGMRFASASDRVSVGFTRSPAEHDRIASLLPFNFDYGGGPQQMNGDRMNGDRGPATERRGQADVDPSVITSAAGGDAVAFGQIYAQIAPRVRRYVRTIIRNPWDAEDVTQDAFVKILTGIGHYDPARGAFSAWSLRVARNTAIDHLRAHRGRLACVEFDQRAPVDDAGRWCGESLRLVLSDLNQNQREILVLRALAGFEPSEIAGWAKATRGSINTLYHRASLAARDRLRAIDAGPCTRTVTKRSPDGTRLSRAA